MRPARTLLVATALMMLSGVPAALASGDPLRDQQYGLDAVRAPEAWTVARGRGVVIAVVDTGIDVDHPDLTERILRDGSGAVIGFDAVDGSDPRDRNGHGTLVAGTVAATTGNGIGIASVAPAARLMPIRVLDDRGRGTIGAVDRGIRWAVDHGADVLNLSLESSVPLPGQVVSSGLDGAVRYAWDRGVVVVAAAGNSGTPFTDFAASTPVLLVGATDQQDRQTTFSDSGRRDMVLAPGVDIVSTHCDPCGADGRPSYASASGTSFAAPHVAGAIAVLRSAGLDHQQAVARLRETARPVPRPFTSLEQGHGLIDVAAAVGADAPAPSAPAPPPPAAPDPSGDPNDDDQRTQPRTPSDAPDAGRDPPAPSTGDTTDEPLVDDPEEEPPADDPGEDEQEPTDPEPVDEPVELDVSLPSPGRSEGPPFGLMLAAGAMIVATGLAALATLRRGSAPPG